MSNPNSWKDTVAEVAAASDTMREVADQWVQWLDGAAEDLRAARAHMPAQVPFAYGWTLEWVKLDGEWGIYGWAAGDERPRRIADAPLHVRAAAVQALFPLAKAIAANMKKATEVKP